jgi:hypothetical protein
VTSLVAIADVSACTSDPYYPVIFRDIPEATLDALDNLVAAVACMEQQNDAADLHEALAKVIDFVRHESIFDIRAFTVWLTRMFKADIPQELVERIRDIKEAKSMLSELAERIERKA